MLRRLSAVVASTLALFLVVSGASLSASADEEPHAQIVGTILDDGGLGVAGINVSVSTNANDQYGSDTTDADGHYAISGLTAATFSVNVNRPRDVPLSEWPYRNLPYRQLTVVSSDATIVNDYQLQLIPTGTGSISGVVKDHISGVVLPGVTVRLNYLSDGYHLSHLQPVITDASGAYTFTGLPPSDPNMPVSISFEKPGTHYTKTLTLRIEAEPIVRNTTLIPIAMGTGSIAGTVRLSNDADFAWGNLSLMTVGWRQVGMPIQLDSEGDGEDSYSFAGLPDGAYQLSFSVPGAVYRFVPVTISGGAATTANVTLTAYETGDAEVWGTVIDARTGDPVAGAPIYLAPLYGQNTQFQTTYSGGDGRWAFEDVADGTYYLNVSMWQVSPPAGALGWDGYLPQVEIEIVDGASVTGQDFELRSFIAGDGVLEGRIRDNSTHLPVDGASVSIYRSTSGTEMASWQADESGTFAAEGLSDGDYYLTVTKEGYTTANASVQVSGGHASIVIPITPRGDTSGVFNDGEISITVFDVDGRRIDDARINGSQPALDADDWVSFDEGVDEDGQLTVSELRAGHWVIYANAQSPMGYRIFAPQHVDISASSPVADLEIHESVGSRITGQVDLNGFPASELVIAAYDETGYWFSNGTVLDDGTYEISDLPAGDIYLALQGGQMGYYGSSFSSSELWATPVYSTGAGSGQTPDFADADPFVLTGGQTIDDVDFSAVAGGSARATIALRTVGSSAPLPASRCLEMSVYRLTGGVWTEYAPGWRYACGSASLLAGGLPMGQYKFEFSDTLSGSTAFRTTYNGDAPTLAAAPAVTVVAGQVTELGTVTVRVPEPDESSLEALDLDFLASDPDFDLSAYEDQVTTDGEPTAGEETEIEVGEEFAGQWVNVSLNSTPIVIGSTWHQVAADGTVTVVLPADVDGAHRLAVGDAVGQLIGWTAVEIAEETSTGGTTGGSSGAATTSKPRISKIPSGVATTPPAPVATTTAAPTPTPVASGEPETAPSEEPESAASDSPPSGNGWILWVVIGGLVVLVAAVGGVIFRRRVA